MMLRMNESKNLRIRLTKTVGTAVNRHQQILLTVINRKTSLKTVKRNECERPWPQSQTLMKSLIAKWYYVNTVRKTFQILQP